MSFSFFMYMRQLSIVMFIVKLQETTLAANQPLAAKRTRSNGENPKNRNSWTETEILEEPENWEKVSQPEYDEQQGNEGIKQAVAPIINLQPLQIRTFIATVAWY